MRFFRRDDGLVCELTDDDMARLRVATELDAAAGRVFLASIRDPQARDVIDAALAVCRYEDPAGTSPHVTRLRVALNTLRRAWEEW